MGNFHCISSGCGRVVYREYLPPSIRWRYEGEDWNEIEGDDYLTEREEFQCPVSYRFRWRHKTSPSRDWKYKEVNPEIYPPYSDFKFRFTDNYGTRAEGFPTLSAAKGDRRAKNTQWFFSYWGYDKYKRRIQYQSPSSYGDNYFDAVATSEFLGGEPIDGRPDNCGECIFKIIRGDRVVHEEIRDRCPEVEQLPCRLNDEIKSIEIKKLPFLEKIEVVPYAYSAYRLPSIPAPIPQADPIPDECLNIYNNAIFVIPPPEDALRDPNATPFNSLVAQICSAPGCSRPEYEVICDCDCRECPSGTCAVACDDRVCCYDTSTGIAVESIPQNEYCGGVE